MFHLVAYDISFNSATETDMTPVPDGIITIQNAHFVPQQDKYILWAAAMGVTIARVRIITPTLRQVTTPFIRPLIEAATPGDQFNFMNLHHAPLLVKGLEEVQLNVVQSSGGAEREIALLALGTSGIVQPVSGSIYAMRGTSTTTTTANAWSLMTVTWQDVLPAGLYSVVGFEGFGATAVAARLTFEDQVWRPGAPLMTSQGQGTWPSFQNGTFGEWGRFNANRMPSVEVLNTAAVATHEFYMYFQRIG